MFVLSKHIIDIDIQKRIQCGVCSLRIDANYAILYSAKDKLLQSNNVILLFPASCVGLQSYTLTLYLYSPTLVSHYTYTVLHLSHTILIQSYARLTLYLYSPTLISHYTYTVLRLSHTIPIQSYTRLTRYLYSPTLVSHYTYRVLHSSHTIPIVCVQACKLQILNLLTTKREASLYNFLINTCYNSHTATAR